MVVNGGERDRKKEREREREWWVTMVDNGWESIMEWLMMVDGDA